MSVLLRRAVAPVLRTYTPLTTYHHVILRTFAAKAGTTRYTKSHEYVKLTGSNTARIGISNHAQSELGDVVYVDLPDKDTTVTAGDRFASVESTKAASDVYAPVDIHITAVNTSLSDDSSVVNSGAEGDGWFVEAELKDVKQLDALMDEAAYKQHCESEKH